MPDPNAQRALTFDDLLAEEPLGFDDLSQQEPSILPSGADLMSGRNVNASYGAETEAARREMESRAAAMSQEEARQRQQLQQRREQEALRARYEAQQPATPSPVAAIAEMLPEGTPGPLRAGIQTAAGLNPFVASLESIRNYETGARNLPGEAPVRQTAEGTYEEAPIQGEDLRDRWWENARPYRLEATMRRIMGDEEGARDTMGRADEVARQNPAMASQADQAGQAALGIGAGRLVPQAASAFRGVGPGSNIARRVTAGTQGGVENVLVEPLETYGRSGEVVLPKPTTENALSFLTGAALNQTGVGATDEAMRAAQQRQVAVDVPRSHGIPVDPESAQARATDENLIRRLESEGALNRSVLGSRPSETHRRLADRYEDGGFTRESGLGQQGAGISRLASEIDEQGRQAIASEREFLGRAQGVADSAVEAEAARGLEDILYTQNQGSELFQRELRDQNAQREADTAAFDQAQLQDAIGRDVATVAAWYRPDVSSPAEARSIVEEMLRNPPRPQDMASAPAEVIAAYERLGVNAPVPNEGYRRIVERRAPRREAAPTPEQQDVIPTRRPRSPPPAETREIQPFERESTVAHGPFADTTPGAGNLDQRLREVTTDPRTEVRLEGGAFARARSRANPGVTSTPVSTPDRLPAVERIAEEANVAAGEAALSRIQQTRDNMASFLQTMRQQSRGRMREALVDTREAAASVRAAADRLRASSSSGVSEGVDQLIQNLDRYADRLSRRSLLPMEDAHQVRMDLDRDLYVNKEGALHRESPQAVALEEARTALARELQNTADRTGFGPEWSARMQDYSNTSGIVERLEPAALYDMNTDPQGLGVQAGLRNSGLFARIAESSYGMPSYRRAAVSRALGESSLRAPTAGEAATARRVADPQLRALVERLVAEEKEKNSGR